jgi:glycosyltransferase involved in cell wall biosynthesis
MGNMNADRTAEIPRLSLIVIARNEEKMIRRCLTSASFADEIIVIDSNSTDRTREIASECGARVIVTHEWPGYGPQKNIALQAATGEWVLSLDSDEWIEPQLADELMATITAVDAADGYKIPRRSRFYGIPVRHSGWWPDHVTRLFRRERGRFSDNLVHERVIVDGPVKELMQPIEHESIIDEAELKEKIEGYARTAASELIASNKIVGRFTAPLHASGALLRTLFLQKGFLDGITGWRVATYNFRYTYRKYQTVYAMQRSGSRT